MDYIAVCREYYEATSLPVTVLKDEKPVYSALGKYLGIQPPKTWALFPLEQNPYFCGESQDILYGRLRIEGTAYDLILGPVFGIPVNDGLVRQLWRELLLPAALRERLAEFVYPISVIGRAQLGRHLAFLHRLFNGKEADSALLYGGGPAQKSLAVPRDDQAGEQCKDVYLSELQIYELIKRGNLPQLEGYLKDGLPRYVGQQSYSPLRRAKNHFLSMAAKAAVIGAIPGGVEIEQAYALLDRYAQSCEAAASQESIFALEHAILLDFCRRAREARKPPEISTDIFLCMNYIESRICEQVTVEEVAEQIHCSTSFLMRKFKEETGETVGEYVRRCKMEEAKSLLTFSKKSLSEIADYLSFSSQPYFQSVFKRYYGVTPMEWRKATRRV